MGRSLEKAVKKHHVAEVVHHGEKLILPEKLDIDDAITLLRKRKEFLNEEVVVQEEFPVFPWDGAFALSQVLITKYGWAHAKPIQSFFGEIKPKVMKIAISPTERVDVPWGHFSLPNIKAQIMTGTAKRNNGLVVFQLSAQVIRKDEQVIRDLFNSLREYLRENSIYRGKAIKMRFRDNDGDPMSFPEPEFLDTSRINPDELIFSQDLMDSIRANLFTPISRVHDCLSNNIKVKRGVVLGGRYGTGKTLAATVAARLATDVGVTFVYVAHADELGDAIDFARQYQSPACVVFCEDIDREVSGPRSVKMDDILNILDGVDTKKDNIITVVTTNHLETINQAMLRPGRLDAIIDVTPPDAEAAVRLVRLYGGDAIDPAEDLSEVGEVLNGQIPAIIEEVVKRAKLFQMDMVPKGGAVTNVSAKALLRSAKTMTQQIELLKEKLPPVQTTLDDLIGNIVEGKFRDGLGRFVAKETAELLGYEG